MKYTKTIPCDNCPFRREGGIRLRQDRIVEIAESECTFACHKTTVEGDDEDGDRHETKDSSECAGRLLFLEKNEMPNQTMRIAERLRMYDPGKFTAANPAWEDVFDDIIELMNASE